MMQDHFIVNVQGQDFISERRGWHDRIKWQRRIQHELFLTNAFSTVYCFGNQTLNPGLVI